jgi:hypothetical protein
MTLSPHTPRAACTEWFALSEAGISRIEPRDCGDRIPQIIGVATNLLKFSPCVYTGIMNEKYQINLNIF